MNFNKFARLTCKTFVFTGLLTLSFLSVRGQSSLGLPQTQIYDHSEVRLVHSIIQDDRGIIYFISSRGVMTYDGVEFETIKGGFSGNANLVKDAHGTIYLSTNRDFFKSEIDSMGHVKFKSLFAPDAEKVSLGITTLVATSQHVYCISDAGIHDYSLQEGKLKHHPGKFSRGFVKDDKLYVTRNGNELLIVDGDAITPAPFADGIKKVIKGKFLALGLPFTNREHLIISNAESKIAAYSGSNPLVRELKPLPIKSPAINLSATFDKNNHLLGTALNGAFLIDTAGTVKREYNIGSGLSTNAISSLFTDRSKNIWLGLYNINKALVKTETGSDLQLWEKSGLMWEMTQFNGKIYGNSRLNLYEINPTTGTLRSVYEKNCDVRSVITFHHPSGDRLLTAVVPDNAIHLYAADQAKPTVIYQGKKLTYIRQSRSNPNRLYFCDNDKLGYLLYDGRNWKPYTVANEFKNVYLVEDNDGSIWVSNLPKTELIRIIPKNNNDILEVKEQITYTQKDGLPAVFFYPYLTGNNELFFMSNIGSVEFDRATNTFRRWKGLGKRFNHLLDEGISNLFKNKYDGSFYVQLNKENEIVQVKPLPNGDTIEVRKPFKRFTKKLGLLDAFAFLPDEKGNVWLGGNAYIVRYNAGEDVKNYEESFSCLIRKVTLDDSVLFAGYLPEKKFEELKPRLLYDSGNLIIRYAAPFYDHEDQTLYSYKLEGLDERWSPWQKFTQREFQHLHEGDYVFLVKAKNVFGNESPVASYPFTVLPPWYRTWWAYVFYAFLSVFTVILLVRWRTQNLRRKKEELEKIVAAKTQELKSTNLELVSTNKELETSQEELQQINDELMATNEYLKKTQRQLVESEKMASLGQFTAGIAHEINNPINFISGGVQAINSVTQELLESKDRTPEKLEETIKDIQVLMQSINKGVTRTSNIISSLKTFANPSEKIDTLIDITDCVENALTLLRHKALDHQINITTRYEHQSKVLANSSQLIQVLTNLIDNAIHALKEIAAERSLSIRTTEHENRVLVRVKDNGMGIAEKDQPHIFEPFFTTKDVGAGVGLGLSISYSIIEKHNGKLSFVSSPGEGTEFIISLPIA